MGQVLNDLNSARWGKKRDEEEGGARKKEGRGERKDGEEGGIRRKEGRVGRRNEESEKMKLLKKMKMKKLLKDASLASLDLVKQNEM